MNMMKQPQVRLRRIREDDFDPLVQLLTRCFPLRSPAYWRRALTRLAARPAPGDYPRFGYLLESDGVPAGAIFTIFQQVGTGADAYVRCNMSSWCVEPHHAGFATLLISCVLKYPEVTYLNISPVRHTLQTIQAQGFSCYSRGVFLSVPALAPRMARARVSRFDPRADYRGLLTSEEIELLGAHEALGCAPLICDAGEEILPFVFLTRRISRARLSLRCAYLSYCRDADDFRRFAGPLGRALAAHGQFFVLADANQAIAGVPGKYFANSGPKFSRGPHVPRLGDLSYTEAVYFEPGF